MIANLTFLLFQTSLGPDLNLLAKLKGKILLVKFFYDNDGVLSKFRSTDRHNKFIKCFKIVD